MPSPFPGMDPWLESRAIFPDLHNSFIAYLREGPECRLLRPYFAAIGKPGVIEGDVPTGRSSRTWTSSGRRRRTAVPGRPGVGGSSPTPTAEVTPVIVQRAAGRDRSSS